MTNWAAGMNISTDRLVASTWSDAQIFTPAVTGAGSLTLTNQSGYCFTAGSLVFFSAYLVVDTAGSGSATVKIGLPFTPDRSQRQLVPVCISGTSTNNGVYSGIVQTGGTDAVIDEILGPTGGLLIGSDLDSGANIHVQGTYVSA